ncbi:MAG: hypothetical protein ACQEQF_02735 [Bacillota bacterium]
MLKKLLLIAKLASKNKINIYLVGGAIRDYLLKYKINDFDFVLKKKAFKISREFANKINGKHLTIDKNNELYRVIKNDLEFDFTVFKGKNIKDDLKYRDFTINAMAIKDIHFKDISLKTKDSFNKSFIIDPFKAKVDLDNHILRAVNKNIFDRDPLRILRAIRFKAKYLFNIESETEKLMKKNKEKLKNVAAERIHNEILKIFSYNNSAEIFKYLKEEIKLFDSGKESLDNFPTYNILKLIDLYNKKNELIFYLDEEKLPLFKITVILFETEKSLDEIESLLKNLRFSNKEISYILTLLDKHNKIFNLYKEDSLKKKSIYEIIKVAKEYTPDTILFSFFIVINSKTFKDNFEKRKDYREYISDFLNKYITIKEKIKEPLINGRDIMKILNIKESPEIGNYIEKLKKAQALDLVNNQEEAVDFIKRLNNQNK